MILNKTYSEPPFCKKEILRYMGSKKADNELLTLLEDSIKEIRDRLTYKVCYCELSVKTDGEISDFGTFRFKSKKLAQNLEGCERVIIFAATLGVEIDRLISKYGRLSPIKALIFQSIGAERIEALANAFCADIAKEYNTVIKPRFSPGYGDLPLEYQKDIFNLLDCKKNIGLTLLDSLVMSPTKSVTAIIGLGTSETQTINKCSTCDMKNCEYRGAL